jgi:hypothetical protein
MNAADIDTIGTAKEARVREPSSDERVRQHLHDKSLKQRYLVPGAEKMGHTHILNS